MAFVFNFTKQTWTNKHNGHLDTRYPVIFSVCETGILEIETNQRGYLQLLFSVLYSVEISRNNKNGVQKAEKSRL